MSDQHVGISLDVTAQAVQAEGILDRLLVKAQQLRDININISTAPPSTLSSGSAASAISSRQAWGAAQGRMRGTQGSYGGPSRGDLQPNAAWERELIEGARRAVSVDNPERNIAWKSIDPNFSAYPQSSRETSEFFHTYDTSFGKGFDPIGDAGKGRKVLDPFGDAIRAKEAEEWHVKQGQYKQHLDETWAANDQKKQAHEEEMDRLRAEREEKRKIHEDQKEFIQFQQYGIRILKGVLAASGVSAAEYASEETSFALTGRHDPMKQASIGPGFLGGLIGAGIGSLFPGYGTLIGAGIGNQVGTTLGELLNAKGVRETRLATESLSTGALSALLNSNDPSVYLGPSGPQQGGDNHNVYNVPAGFRNRAITTSQFIARGVVSWEKDIRDFYRGQFTAEGVTDETAMEAYTPTAEELARGAGALYKAILMGGRNPEEKVRSYYYGDTGTGDRGNRNILSAVTEFRMSDRYQAMSRNAAIRYLKDAPNILEKEIAPIEAANPETGGNVADILTKFGAIGTQYYQEVNTNVGQQVKTTLNQLSEVSTGLRNVERSLGFFATRARGAGAAMEGAYTSEMSRLASLPGGTESLAYATANQKRREAELVRIGETMTTDYEIPMMGLRARRDIAQSQPFNPGNIFALDMSILARNVGQIQNLQRTMSELRRKNDLSVPKEAEMTGKIWDLEKEDAGMIGQLGWHFSDRLPEMYAGRNAYTGRANSYQGAAMSVYQSGMPIGEFGFAGGGHMKSVMDFVKSFGLGSLSPSQRMGDTGPMSDPKVVNLLERIASSLDRMNAGSSGGRQSEALGHAASKLAPYAPATYTNGSNMGTYN